MASDNGSIWRSGGNDDGGGGDDSGDDPEEDDDGFPSRRKYRAAWPSFRYVPSACAPLLSSLAQHQLLVVEGTLRVQNR